MSATTIIALGFELGITPRDYATPTRTVYVCTTASMQIRATHWRSETVPRWYVSARLGLLDEGLDATVFAHAPTLASAEEVLLERALKHAPELHARLTASVARHLAA